MSTTISRLYNWVTDKANSVKITASRMDGEMDQVITALNRKVLCSGSAPSGPIAGQTWFDTTNKLLKAYRNNEWVVQGAVHVGTSAPATPQEGDLWWDSTNNKLYAYDGSTQQLVYPVATINSNYILEGYATGRNVIRRIVLLLQPGATPGTNINVTAETASGVGFNGPTITNATDLAKGGSNGSFALNAGGTAITMDITPAIVAILSESIIHHDLNNSSLTAGDIWFPRLTVTSGNLVISLAQDGGTAEEDLTTILQAGDAVRIGICFVTST